MVRCAEQYGVTIAIEPVVKHIVYDAKRARTVLDEIGSPNLQGTRFYELPITPEQIAMAAAENHK